MTLPQLLALGATAASAEVAGALANWYAAHPSVRCLWALAETRAAPAASEHFIRVIVKIEPSVDSDENSPVWLANSGAWGAELEKRAGCLVQLERIDDDAVSPSDAVERGQESVLLVALTWRDPSASFI